MKDKFCGEALRRPLVGLGDRVQGLFGLHVSRFGDKDRGLFLADEGRGLLVGLGDTLRCLADVGRNDGDEGDDDPLEGEIAALASSIDCIFWADEGFLTNICGGAGELGMAPSLQCSSSPFSPAVIGWK